VETDLPSHLHKPSGVVYLVGAGPGDPGLLTVRGAELLASADVVIYDALVNPALLRHCPRAEKIFAGKQAAVHFMKQDEINALLIEHARAGKCVVRLKGGDPFVFGRGGEECEALAAEQLRFEVVPGITAAIAAPAYAGIPVTHRDFNSSFTFITGHEKEEEYREADAKTRAPGAGSDIDWAVAAKLPCLAFYMGVKSLPRICAKLIEHGMNADTPAATIYRGTTPRQRTVVGTIGNLPQRVAAAQIAPPAMTIIGQVVSLRDTMNWFESRPLFGQTVVVTRTREQASDLTEQLAELGAHVIEAPTIEVVPSENSSEADAVLRGMDKRAESFDWIIFTSQQGVSHAKRRLFELGLDVRVFGQAKIAAIGDATAKAIREQLGLRVDVCPEKFVAEALAEALIEVGKVTGKRFLLLRADIARPILRERLEQAGATEVRDVAIYETRLAGSLPAELLQALDARQVNWVTFTSSSTAKNFLALLGDDYRRRLEGVHLASIGPITTNALRESGLEPTVQAETYNIAGLLEAIIKGST
jgi:uroporphyrinogen III methyltransferase/synthase